LTVRKKILVVLSRVPYPLDKGDKLRAFHQIKSLSEQHDVFLFALNDTKIHPKSIEVLNQYCKEICIASISKIEIAFNLMLGIFGNKPFQVYYFHHQSAQRKFDAFYQKVNPDAIYCQLIRTAEYAKHINKVPKTIDYQDAFAKGMERRIKNATFFLKPFFRSEHERLRKYEHIIFHYFERHIIISEQDKNYIIHEENNKIEVIPNGVDLDYFSPQIINKDFDLVFTGNMSYPPNINCAQFLVNEVMPLVWKKRHKSNILISGTSPTNEVLSLASNRVKISGWVEDMRESYARSRIFIAPMQIGTGLQNKLLEAMAMQLPCITSPLANAPLGAKNKQEILVGENANEVAALILDLLENENKIAELAQQGRLFVELNYSWKTHNKKLTEIIIRDT
jgi:sugar transferase (PEP-CTERM/EpsH1 system associated)